MGRALYMSAKEGGVGTLSSISTFSHKQAPTSCLQQLDALEANNWTNKKLCPGCTQNSEWHVRVVHATLATSIYTKKPIQRTSVSGVSVTCSNDKCSDWLSSSHHSNGQFQNCNICSYDKTGLTKSS